MLWNPYNKPLKVQNLYAFVPLGRDKNGQLDNRLKIKMFKFDLREYDLFRKWWMYVSGKEKPKKELISGSNKWTTKDFNAPWPLFPASNFNFGLIYSMLGPDGAYSKEGTEMSLQKNGSTWKFIHQNPRIDEKDDPSGEFFLMREFTFYNCESPPDITLDHFVLKLGDTTILPGETISYTVDSSFPNSGLFSEAQHIITMKPRGSELHPYILETGEKFEFGAINIRPTVYGGLNDSSSDQLNYEGGRFVYEANKKPITTSLFEWKSTAPFNRNSEGAKLIYASTYDVKENFPTKEIASLGVYTKGILKKNFENQSLIQNYEFLPGLGINLELLLPGDKRNERIMLNDFNVRHLVHSEQHGMGSWYWTSDHELKSKFYSEQDLNYKHLQFLNDTSTYNVIHSDWNDSLGYERSFIIPGIHVPGAGGVPEDMHFPDFYNFDSNFPTKDIWLGATNRV